jgi:hypothetical protein
MKSFPLTVMLCGTALLLPLASQAAITVDGILDEPEWDSAQVFSNFVVTEPLTGEPSPYKTEARVYSDKKGIYVGFSNYQPPAVKRTLRRFPRDADIRADRNVVGIDFDGSGLSGYDFTVGIANSRQDGIFNNEKEYSSEWDGIWYSKTSQTTNYWYTEIFIPWKVAPMTRAVDGEKTMRFYLGRVVYEESMRLATPNASFERPTFLSDWKPVTLRQFESSSLDWFPYLSATHGIEEVDSEAKAGLEMVWRPNSGTQLTATLNPDFGQVESDDVIVNFSAFETFFDERRPFFTENQALFDSRVPGGDQLIHTRRIGAAPDLGDNTVSDIIGGAKFSHYGDTIDYGGFAVIEEDTGASDGRSFATTRIQTRQDSLVLGHSLTFVDRSSLDRTALVNSVDADYTGDNGFRMRGQLFYSDIDQQANRANQHRDVDDQDGGGWTEVDYAPDDENQFTMYLLWYGEDFDMNDMGYLKRNDWFRQSFQYRRDNNRFPEDSSLLRSYWRIKPQSEQNYDGDLLKGGVEMQYFFGFRDTRELNFQAYLEVTDRDDDRITRGNGVARLDPQHSFFASYLSPRASAFNWGVTYVAETKGTDKFAHEFDFNPELFVTETLTLRANLSYTWFDEWLLWDFRSEQLATYQTDLYEVGLNLDWYPSQRQEVRVKFQWAGVSAEAREGFALGNNGKLTASGVPVDDFSVADTGLQIRYRYRIAPLSDFFLVYSRGGYFGDDRQTNDFSDLWSNAWDEVTGESILAKIRYRF